MSENDIIVAPDGGEVLEDEPGLSDEHLRVTAELLDARIQDDLARDQPEDLSYDILVAVEARDYIRSILEDDTQ